MANVYIQQVRIVDSNRAVLPIDPASGGYKTTVDPATSLTPQLNFEVTCVLIPSNTIQLPESATLINLADFLFTMGDGKTINYVRQVADRTALYLAFQLKVLNPPASCLPADMLIQVQGDNVAQHTVRLVVN